MSSYLSQYINENKKELKSSPINEQARASLTNEQKIEGRQLAKALAQKGDLNISRGDLERLLNPNNLGEDEIKDHGEGYLYMSRGDAKYYIDIFNIYRDNVNHNESRAVAVANTFGDYGIPDNLIGVALRFAGGEQVQYGLRRLLYYLAKSGKITTSSDTCLLYTSPSPRDMRRSRMPSSA